MILTDEHGRPIARPERSDYPDDVSWMRAIWAWNDGITLIANGAFSKEFAAALRRR